MECDFYIGIKKSIDFNVCKGERIGHAWTVISGQILDETNLLFWNSMLLYHNEGMKCDEHYEERTKMDCYLFDFFFASYCYSLDKSSFSIKIF